MDNAKIGTVTMADLRPESAEPRTLREATQEFESLFIAQMMQAMRGTVQESGLMGSGTGQRVFREMLDQEFAKRIATSGGFGIGDMLYRQLSPGDEAVVSRQSSVVSNV